MKDQDTLAQKKADNALHQRAGDILWDEGELPHYVYRDYVNHRRKLRVSHRSRRKGDKPARYGYWTIDSQELLDLKAAEGDGWDVYVGFIDEDENDIGLYHLSDCSTGKGGDNGYHRIYPPSHSKRVYLTKSMYPSISPRKV
jgi:hypothetical protein